MNKAGKYFISGVLALVCHLEGMLPAYADSEACSTVDIIEKINQALSGIKDYQFRSSVTIDGNQVISNIKGMPPNLMRIDMSIEQGSFVTHMTNIFDGTYQWVEIRYPSAVEVSKVELERVTIKDRPFDSSYYLMGSGLLNGEDYPSTVSTLISIYDLSAKCGQDEIELSGPLSIKKFIQYAGTKNSGASVEGRVKKYSDNFGVSHLFFNSKTFALNKYTLGTEKNPDFFSAKYENFRFNKGLEANTFTYFPPEGVQPVNITNDLLKQAGNHD
jgi:outer membrane lipoprotein-sorting protein